MNQLPLPKRAQIINLLVEGNSMRATSRIADVSINTVTKLLVEIGAACENFHNEMVRNVASKRLQVHEIWLFIYSKQKNIPSEKQGEAGDIWTWTGIDADSKLIVSWFVGDRSMDSAKIFMKDVASRVTERVQVSTDGNLAYSEAIEAAWGADVDYGQIVKKYDADTANDKRYRIGATKTVVQGNSDREHISTSYVERPNLTMRMHMRRFTRLTNGFSKKVDNHMCPIALHFVYYNFVRVHKTLGVTPAMEAGLTKKPMTTEEIVALTRRN